MTQRISSCVVETRDVEIGGLPVRYHVIRTQAGTGFGLHYDVELDYAAHVVLEPDSMLISQAGTAAKISRAAGFMPGDRLLAQQPSCVGIVSSNFWQTGTFLLHANSEGGVNSFAGVRLDGVFTALVKNSVGWDAVNLKFHQGRPDRPSQRIIDVAEMGFSLPLILRDGQVRRFDEYADDPRIIGDTRNFADYAFGKTGLPADFWLLLRRVMPSSGKGLLAVLRGEKWTETRDDTAMTLAEFAKFSALIESNGLSGNLLLERRDDQIRFTIVGPAPVQRIPVVGVGFDDDHQLIVVVVEGRQPHSAGVSSVQLAQLMKDEGAVTAGLGAAGGDAGVWANVGGEFRTFSSGPYRPCPCLLIMG